MSVSKAKRGVLSPRASSKKSVGRTSPSAATALGTKRPEFIILFRERASTNVSLLSRKLGVGQAPGVAARAGMVVLQGNHEWAARPRVYERMGLAVADLDQKEHDALVKDDGIAAVIRNEIRRIPPIIEYREGQEERDGQSASAHLALPADSARLDAMFAAGNGPLAYACGMRDTADMLVRILSASKSAAPAPVALASTSHHSWALSLIGIHESYEKATGADVRVAVLDTGIDLNHPDFASKLGAMELESFIPGETVQDGHGHGTHCAGVIAGAANSSGSRRYSVAPDAELIVGKVLSNAGAGYDDQIIEGIDWAADAGARVISMSLGSVRNVGESYREDYELVAATRLAESPGILIVAAAGNESARPSYTRPVGNPAACPSILAVAALDRFERIASFSSAQMDGIGRVDVAGPGVGIYSAWTGGGFKTISGTSMATPHAAGVCALLLELEPKLTPRQLWARLEATCRNLSVPSDFGAGLIQAP